MEFSFIHVADIHLDRPFSGLSDYSFDDNLAKICKNAMERSFNNVIDFAVMKNVDFVLIAGDTFDGCEHDFSSKLILKRGLQRLINADINVYLICGNHDPIISYSKNTFDYDENSRIKIIGLNTSNGVEIPINCPNKFCDITQEGETGLDTKNTKGAITLHALSFSEEKFDENPVKYFKRAENGFNIGLLHCDLNASSDSHYAPCLYSELKSLNYDYFALGHIHLPSDTEDNILYSGTIQGRNTKETGAHGLRYIKVKDNVIVKNTFVSTDIIRFEDIEADISFAHNSVDALNIIEDKIREKVINTENQAEIYLIKPHITGCCSCFSEINAEFFNVLSDKIKTDFYGKVYISQAQCDICAKIDEDILSNDDGISGEIFKTVNNEEILNNTFLSVEEKLKNIIDNCNFSEEEFINFKKNLMHTAKEECKNICSIIYESTGVNE